MVATEPAVEKPLPAAIPPVAPKDLTMSKIRAAIPPHCFERSLLRSLGYLARDLVLIALLGLGMWRVERALSGWLLWVCWGMYWWWQGAVMTGVWVLAHECGHQAFSPWKSVNDAVGWVLHSALLVPYHSWRITHGMHHKKTNHMEGDQVFVPSTRTEYDETFGVSEGKFESPFVEALQESPLGDWFNIFKMFLLGWPAYLSVNAAGQRYEKTANHFWPGSPMFEEKDWWDVVVSDIGLGLVFAVLGYCSWTFSFVAVLKYYFVPYLIVNSWLVLITYLHHSDPMVPHYAPKEWTFIRGALCSVDRDYGIYNILQHHIGDTHVAHHMFSTMPHYHAQEATECLKRVLGPYYRSDSTPILKAVFRSWSSCKFVDPSDGGVMFFRSYKAEREAEEKAKLKAKGL